APNLDGRRVRHPAREYPAASLIDTEAATIPGARDEVRPEHPLFREQQFVHSLQRGRAINLEFGDMARALVPSREYQARIVAAVIVVQMAEEQVRDACRRDAKLEQPMVRAKSMVENDDVLTDLDNVAGAHAPQGWRRRPGSQKTNSHQKIPLSIRFSHPKSRPPSSDRLSDRAGPVHRHIASAMRWSGSRLLA